MTILGFYFKSVILFFFLVQGLLFSVIVFIMAQRYNHVAGKWLGGLLFLGALYISPWMFGHAGWYAEEGYRDFLLFTPLQHLFLIGPFIYFYMGSLFDPKPIKRADYLHFIPSGIYLIYIFLIFLADYVVLDAYYFYNDQRDKDIDPWYQITGHVSMAIYTVLSLNLYNRYRKRIYNELSYADSVVYSWAKRFLIILFCIFSVWILFYSLFPSWGSFGDKWWYYLIFSMLFYYIGLEGYSQLISSVSIQAQAMRSGRREEPEALTDDDFRGEDNVRREELMNSIKLFMESENGYRNPTLALSDVAWAMNTNVRVVSNTINQGFKMNFNDFVNSYRIKEVKRKIDAGDHLKYTLLGIAFDCGFNSKTTFNRVFKKMEGESPQEYLKKSKL